MPVDTVESWPPGLPRTLDYPQVPAGAILAGAARRFGDRVAFARGEDSLTYAELGRRAAAFAHGLLDRGLSTGDRVALRMPNCLEYPVAYYGTLLAGGVFVPVNPLLPEAAAAAQIEASGARLTVPAADVPGICAGQPVWPPAVEIDVDDDLAHLAYTGGTRRRAEGGGPGAGHART